MTEVAKSQESPAFAIGANRQRSEHVHGEQDLSKAHSLLTGRVVRSGRRAWKAVVLQPELTKMVIGVEVRPSQPRRLGHAAEERVASAGEPVAASGTIAPSSLSSSATSSSKSTGSGAAAGTLVEFRSGGEAAFGPSQRHVQRDQFHDRTGEAGWRRARSGVHPATCGIRRSSGRPSGARTSGPSGATLSFRSACRRRRISAWSASRASVFIA